MNSDDQLKSLLQKHGLSFALPPSPESWSGFLNELSEVFQKLDSKTKRSLQQKNDVLEKINKHVISTSKLSSLSGMIGGVVHEINNPLAVIQMRTDQLVEELDSETSIEKQFFKKNLTVIDDTLKRIAIIIARLRVYAKTSTHEPLQIVSFKSIIESSIQLCSDRFTNYSVQIDLRINDDGEINCKPLELTQALLLALMNSYESVIQTEKKWIRMTLSRMNSDLILEIQDSGPTIALEVQDKMFEPFFTTKGDKHSGLGLNIIKGLAEELHGRFEFIKDPQVNRFVLALPMTTSGPF